MCSGVGKCWGGLWGSLAFGSSGYLPFALGILKVAEQRTGVCLCSETCCFQGGCPNVGAGAEGPGGLLYSRAQPGWGASALPRVPGPPLEECLALSCRKLAEVSMTFLYVFIFSEIIILKKCCCEAKHETVSYKLTVLVGYTQL